MHTHTIYTRIAHVGGLLVGYGGEFCEEVINDCDSLSCLDGVECTSDVGCPCPNGYLTFDSKCIDIDECAADDGPCQQVCTNIPGSYQCSCFPGYFYNNNKTCEGKLCKICNTVLGKYFSFSNQTLQLYTVFNKMSILYRTSW